MHSTKADHYFANVCHVCRVYGKNIELKRCSSCKSVAYCNREHQIAHWPKHKELCRVLSEIIKVNGRLYGPLDDLKKNPKSWVKEKKKLITLVRSKLGRELLLHEKQMLEFPRSCEICHETLSNKLRDCKKCPNASFCTKHPDQDQHFAKCEASQLCFTMTNTNFGLGNGFLVRMAFGSHHDEKIPKNMEAAMKLFLTHCPANKTDASTKLWLKLISDHLSRPYTFLFSMEKLSRPALRKMTIHVIDSSPKENFPTNAWQTLLHHISSLKELKIVFVGPKLSADPEELELCQDCVDLKRRIIVQNVGDSYLNFVTARSFTKPDYIIGFNLQICDSILENDPWIRTFKVFRKLGCPFSITSSSPEEFEAHRIVIDAFLNKKVKYLWAGRNPMSGLNPRRDIENDNYWYLNQWITIYGKLA